MSKGSLDKGSGGTPAQVRLANGEGPATTDVERGPHFVQSLERGLAVIRAFDGDHTAFTLSELAARADMTRAGARRYLLTLVDLGYVSVSGRYFSLRPRVLELGYSYLSTLPLSDIAIPHLEQLVDTIHESSSVAVLDGGDVVYVARVHTSRIMTMAINIGTRLPAWATSMGRVLLANFDKVDLQEYLENLTLQPFTPRTATSVESLLHEISLVHSQGYSIVDQELELGLRSVAVPVRDRTGQVVAAMNVSSPAMRRSLTQIRKELLPQLKAAAAQIEGDLRFNASAPRGWSTSNRREESL